MDQRMHNLIEPALQSQPGLSTFVLLLPTELGLLGEAPQDFGGVPMGDDLFGCA